MRERLAGRLGHVVPDDQLTLGLDARDQLVELEGEQPAVRAQLHDVLGDLGGDAAHHLQPLRDRRDVPDGHQVLDLQRGERARDLVEAELVPLQGRQGLVRAGEDRGRVLQDPALPVHVQRDQPHRLADRDDREAGLDGDPLRRAVPGARLLGGDRRVRDQLHARPQDLGDVACRGSAPPSSLHSSRSRVAVNSTSRTKPPVHIGSTVLSMPRTISPPVLPRRIRSRPSRRAVPGATALSVARIRPSAPEPPPDLPGAAARSLAATALLRS